MILFPESVARLEARVNAQKSLCSEILRNKSGRSKTPSTFWTGAAVGFGLPQTLSLHDYLSRVSVLSKRNPQHPWLTLSRSADCSCSLPSQCLDAKIGSV